MSPTSYQTALPRDMQLFQMECQKETNHRLVSKEASTRFELVMKVLQTSALPLGYDATSDSYGI